MLEASNHAPRAGSREGSLLRAQGGWILTITVLAVVVACTLSWAMRHPQYKSEVQVLVSPDVSHATPIAPNMETERQIMLSGVVVGDAAWMTGALPSEISQGLAVTVPAGSTVMVVDYTDRTPADAEKRARAVAKAYGDFRGSQATIVSYPTVPVASSDPSYLVSGLAGLVIGLLLGFGSAVLRDRLDDRVRGPHDFADQSGLPVLAVVPVPRRRRAGALAALPVLDDPWSPGCEAYRQVRGKVVRAAQRLGRSRAITVVTSAAEDDDATSLAISLAVLLARGGGQVLLVEGDIGGRPVSRLLDLPVEVGLVDVLTGRVAMEAALRPGPVDGLRLLPAGLGVPSIPGDVFDEGSLARLIAQVPTEVAHVVVAAPPVVGAAETLLVADQADLCLLAAVIGGTRRRDVRSAVAELTDARAQVLGGVVSQGVRRRRLGRARPSSIADPGRWTSGGAAEDDAPTTIEPAAAPDPLKHHG